MFHWGIEPHGILDDLLTIFKLELFQILEVIFLI